MVKVLDVMLALTASSNAKKCCLCEWCFTGIAMLDNDSDVTAATINNHKTNELVMST
jgi:hypothetical protein